MKKFRILGLGAIALAGITAVSLTSCGSENGIDVYGAGLLGTLKKYGQSSLEFKENSAIPYISLENGVELMTNIRSSNLEGEKYKFTIKKENDNYVISNEKGAKCTVSAKNQTFTFDDFDKFTSLVYDNQNPLTLVPVKSDFKLIKQTSSQYNPGSEHVIDLKPYSKLDIYEKNGRFYIPLSVFNSALFNTYDGVSLAYNGKNLFLISAESLTQQGLDGPETTALADKFREDASTTYTEEYAEYFYQSLCFDFDYEYGLKEKFTTFDKWLTDGGFKSHLMSTDPKEVDNYTAIALSYLNDGHTNLAEFSNMYKYGDNQIDKEKLYKPKSDWNDQGEALAKAKKQAGVKDGIEYKGDTVFVAFKEFTAVNEDVLYSSNNSIIDELGLGSDEESDDSENTAVLFSKLYKDLTSDKYKNTIKNIVIDLTTNDGGDAGALTYSLSTLIGDVYFDMTNPRTGGHNHQTYMVDMNLDGNAGNDKCLADLGFNIYFLNSKYSFSSANAMPYVAKINKPNVVLLGDKTAGGPCAVRSNTTPIGSVIASSSLNTISKFENGKYVNIDDGVKADFTLTEAQMIDRNYIAQHINSYKLS